MLQVSAYERTWVIFVQWLHIIFIIAGALMSMYIFCYKKDETQLKISVEISGGFDPQTPLFPIHMIVI